MLVTCLEVIAKSYWDMHGQYLLSFLFSLILNVTLWSRRYLLLSFSRDLHLISLLYVFALSLLWLLSYMSLLQNVGFLLLIILTWMTENLSVSFNKEIPFHTFVQKAFFRLIYETYLVKSRRKTSSVERLIPNMDA